MLVLFSTPSTHILENKVKTNGGRNVACGCHSRLSPDKIGVRFSERRLWHRPDVMRLTGRIWIIMVIQFLFLCPLSLTAKLNFNISKTVQVLFPRNFPENLPVGFVTRPVAIDSWARPDKHMPTEADWILSWESTVTLLQFFDTLATIICISLCRVLYLQKIRHYLNFRQVSGSTVVLKKWMNLINYFRLGQRLCVKFVRAQTALGFAFVFPVFLKPSEELILVIFATKL